MSQFGDMRHANSGDSAISRRASVNWIMLIYFASGVCSLIDEVVWVRLLKLTLGNTVYASSIVVSVFMGGLALGAVIMGRHADRVREHLRLYALLETLVTISALSLPFALIAADTVYVWFYRTYYPSHSQLLAVQVIISAAILLVPSMLMGSTLPLLGRFVTALEKEVGHLVGRLYALNTLGAAAGCFLAGFVLIRFLGVMGALYTAAILNFLVASGGWFLSRFSRIAVEERIEAVVTESTKDVTAKTATGRFYLLVIAFFMSGLISIGYELLWMRSIVHLLGGFTYVFSAVLTVYLLGNVIGAGIGSKLAVRLKVPAVGFAVTLSLLGLYGIFYLQLMILWMSKLLPHVNRTIEAVYPWVPVSSFVVEPIVQSVFLFLVPAIIMGIGFPMALQAWANHLHRVGRSTGAAYGANTIGAVIGGIVTGFVLIPLLGVQISTSMLGLIGVWIAGILCLLFVGSSRAVGRFSILSVAIILTIFVLKAPSDLFNTVVEINPELPKSMRLLAVKEGVTTTVSVHRDPKLGTLNIYSSGRSIAGDDYSARGDQKMLGHFGVLLNKDVERVLSVGFGSGESTACLAQHKLGGVDCVEIAPEVVEVGLQFFKHINLGDRLGEEINMIYMDAKNYTHLTDINYDSIVNDSIHPRDFAENASLYGKEYFESAKERLNKNNGLFLSWLPTYKMPVSVVSSIIGTAMDVFPHTTLWYLTANPAPLVMIVGSEKQQYFSPRHMENELLKKTVSESLSKINIHNSIDVLSCYIGDEDDLRQCIKTYFVNSDYWPFVEFTTDNWTPRERIFRQFVMNVRGDSVYRHIDWTGFSQKEKDAWRKDYQQLYKASGHLFKACASTDGLKKLRYIMDGLGVLPDSPALLYARAEAEKQLVSDSTAMMVSGEKEKALVLTGQILEVYPESASAWMIKSAIMLAKGDMPKALAASQQAVGLAPDNANAHFSLGFVLFKLGRFENAIKEYRQVLQLAERTHDFAAYNQVQTLNVLTACYAAAGRRPEAIATAEKAFDLASSTGQKKMAGHIRKQLLSLKASRTPR